MTPVTLPGSWLAPDGAEHACALRGTCLDDLELGGAPIPDPGAGIVVRVPEAGTLDARVVNSTPDGVRLSVEGGPGRLRRIDGRLRWAFRNVLAASEQRQNARVVPHKREVTVLWDGSEMSARLADVSVDGAAVILLPRPVTETDASAPGSPGTRWWTRRWLRGGVRHPLRERPAGAGTPRKPAARLS